MFPFSPEISRVFILATCRKPEYLPFTTLVFKTLRTGFPTAQVTVSVNDMDNSSASQVLAFARSANASVEHVKTIHHEWIEKLVASENKPFFILDTDVVFYSNFERFKFNGPIAGWRIPEWKDEFSRAITRARLHTSLLYIDPVQVRKLVSEFTSTLPDGPFTPFVNPFYPLCIPFKNRMHFYDTCSLLYHAIGGQPFTDEQKNAYFHFNFGTIPDIVLPRLSDDDRIGMESARSLVLQNTDLGIGMWRQQEEYYRNHQT